MNLRNHPCTQAFNFFSNVSATLQFSVYKYTPQTVLDERQILEVSTHDFDLDWVENQILSLNPNEELAIHSKYKKILKKTSQQFHFPMIDFCCPSSDIEIARLQMSKVLPHHIFAGLMFYDSGRSLHAYGSTPITNAKWIEFMGRLLLANLPGQKSIVDSRWIGHRLLGGYSSLRWSSNSDHYLKYPAKI